MPSPFPGMNPYLEREGIWHGLHERLCVYFADALAPQLEPNYFVDIDEHVYIHELDAQERQLVGRPDNLVVSVPSSYTPSASGLATPAPLYTRLPSSAVDEEHLSYLKILDGKKREVVVVIELLSPVNKTSGRQEYLAKRQHYRQSGIGLVEIDLLRAGRRLPLQETPRCDYLVAVMRPGESPRIGLWPIQLRDPLPLIPVPLRAGDPDASLDLQTLLSRVYDAGSYEKRIYEDEPEPQLSAADMQWAKQFVPNAK